MFRRALLDKNANINVLPAGRYIDEAETVRSATYHKQAFFVQPFAAQLPAPVLVAVAERLTDRFEYHQFHKVVLELQAAQPDAALKTEYEQVLWLADTYYDLTFSLDTDLSDRVLFPVSELERKGMEDARFVRFVDDGGGVVYYATYTAYDGHVIAPKLLMTRDFYSFRGMPLHGAGARNKNLALFPRKVNGRYAMRARVDGWSNYLMFSDNLTIWEDPVQIQEPQSPWEFVQIGNCGSPIETGEGWLVITHGVGPMRRYCLGVSLLALDDPAVEIGRLSEPLLIPNKEEREGYVPNVLYSCGSIVHNGKRVIPYGLSDYCSSFVTVDLALLLEKLCDPGAAVDMAEPLAPVRPVGAGS